ncbi:MAG: hypothetical protein QOJ16_2844 [Acidobacteriota bacterium]|jgi:hypothetical protein|nr:hypothetical protein [Acidobacteriota bacterium]
MPKEATAVAAGRALLLAPLLTLSACAKDASASLTTVTSWAATARLAGESWSAGRVPTPYTRRALEAAEKGIAEAEKDLAKAEDLPAARGDALRRVTGTLRQAVSEARAAVERRDRGALSPALARLAAGERAVATARNSGGGGR